MAARQPESAVLAVAEAASQAAGCKFERAAATLNRAAGLCPGDRQLAEMSRVATEISRGATPVTSAPDGSKRPKPGDLLDGWQLERLLGHGGWGLVFLARKGEFSRALKIMHAELSRDAELVKRFEREMMTLGGLGAHPDLVHIDPDHLFDFARDWSCWYYVMEYIEGASLERYLAKNGALTLGQARPLFAGIAEGLAAAHARGIIHRDIKPANILLRKQAVLGQGQGVLVDFGLAGLVDAHTRGAGYTAVWAAPEQFKRGASDRRSDIYSLAATIYYSLLYGDVDKRDLYKARLLPADVPTDLRDLLERCLDHDPAGRPQDAAAFVMEWSKKVKPPPPPPPPPPMDNPERLEVPLKRGGKLMLDFVRIPKGTFLMGSPKSERDDVIKRYNLNATDLDDEPEHQVEITRDYWLGKTAVTRGQIRAFVEDEDYKTEGEKDGKGGYGWTGTTWGQKPEFTWKNPGCARRTRIRWCRSAGTMPGRSATG